MADAALIVGADMKVCRTCGDAKPLHHFGRVAKNRDGLMGDCRACSNGARVRKSRMTEGPTPLPRPDASWMTAAACRNMPMAMFFPERGESSAEAKEICRSCPVQTECLDYCFASHEKTGIWGGVTEVGRRRIRAERAAS